MTLKSFGRARPIHMHMLKLVGYEAVRRDLTPATDLQARKKAMKTGLESLRRETGFDFGYDAAAWRKCLIQFGADFGYTHPYAFQSVDKAVRTALADPEVISTLAALAETE